MHIFRVLLTTERVPCQDDNSRVYISRHVTFNETMFSFKTISSGPALPMPSSQCSSRLLVLLPDRVAHTSQSSVTSPATQVNLLNAVPQSNSPSPVHSISEISTSRTHAVDIFDQPPSPAYVSFSSHAMVTCSKAGIFKSMAYMSTATCLSKEVPTDIHEAMCNEYWKVAVHSELQALLQNNTWNLCSLPNNQRVIGYKWLFKVKKKADGTVERYKARLVAKGFSRLNFRNTFSPVV